MILCYNLPCDCVQSEIANRRAQQNNFVRQLGDISRTLRSMGLYHQIQVNLTLLEWQSSSVVAFVELL